MAYSTTSWETGDVITKQKLNNVETGVENLDQPGFVNIPTYGDTFTYNNIKALIESGKIPYYTTVAGDDYTLYSKAYLCQYEATGSAYNVYFRVPGNSSLFNGFAVITKWAASDPDTTLTWSSAS